MPDLTFQRTAWCTSNKDWTTEVASSAGDGSTYTVRWCLLPADQAEAHGAQYGYTCTCKGYHYRWDCRHVREVRAAGMRCAWNAELEVTLSPAQHPTTGDPCCPDCGGPVSFHRVAV